MFIGTGLNLLYKVSVWGRAVVHYNMLLAEFAVQNTVQTNSANTTTHKSKWRKFSSHKGREKKGCVQLGWLNSSEYLESLTQTEHVSWDIATLSDHLLRDWDLTFSIQLSQVATTELVVSMPISIQSVPEPYMNTSTWTLPNSFKTAIYSVSQEISDTSEAVRVTQPLTLQVRSKSGILSNSAFPHHCCEMTGND